MASMIMNDLGFDAGAMQKNWEIWKKQSREWGRFDRIEMTEAQAIALAERTMIGSLPGCIRTKASAEQAQKGVKAFSRW